MIAPVQLMDQIWNLPGILPLTTYHQHSVAENECVEAGKCTNGPGYMFTVQ